jgi:hypothetical protein
MGPPAARQSAKSLTSSSDTLSSYGSGATTCAFLRIGCLSGAARVLGVAVVTWRATRECSFSTGAVFDLSGGRSTY